MREWEDELLQSMDEPEGSSHCLRQLLKVVAGNNTVVAGSILNHRIERSHIMEELYRGNDDSSGDRVIISHYRADAQALSRR